MNAALAIKLRLLLVFHLISLLQFTFVSAAECKEKYLLKMPSIKNGETSAIKHRARRSSPETTHHPVDTSREGLRIIKIFVLLAGTCWSAMMRHHNGRCTEVLHEKISREDCCSGHSVTTSWSAEEFDSSALFFWRVLGGGVTCSSCRDSCKDVECGVDKNCVIRKGVPKCVCSSKCKEGKLRPKGPVCGTDGRSYRNICSLRKQACRRRSSTLSVAYKGICQSSCDKISCPSGKHCLLDQNVVPHCVNCTKKCPNVSKRRQVCGSDDQTYPSACHLREKACQNGKAIPIAYKGPCRANATCSKVRCRDRQTCLKDLETGMPRCVTCSTSCRPRHLNGPICGTNNGTYPTWCHMTQDACKKGYVIDTKHSGKCKNTNI